MRIEIPEGSLVSLVGASCSGKTTFAKKHFAESQVLSSDSFRRMVCDDENNQQASADAFDALYLVASKRLLRNKLTVIDSTGASTESRKNNVQCGKNCDVNNVAIVFNLPYEELVDRLEKRTDGRTINKYQIKKQWGCIKQAFKHNKKEGFRFVYILNSQEDVDNAEIVYTKSRINQQDVHDPLDIIGDVHGCYDELVELVEQLGYMKNEDGFYIHPDNRKLVFLGDLTDRGPKNTEVLDFVMGHCNAELAYCVLGNHDFKLIKKLHKRAEPFTHGIEITLNQIDKRGSDYANVVMEFLNALPTQYVFDDGKLVVAHAGMREEYIGKGSMRVRAYCMYGDTSGETDEYGLPVHIDWASSYTGKTEIVYGHIPNEFPDIKRNTYNIDTGCVFGNKLTALRYPENETVSVNAHQMYFEPLRSNDDKNVMWINGFNDELNVSTSLFGNVKIKKAFTYNALEEMSRFAVNPRQLIYLSPTMSPCSTSSLEDYLEYPTEAIEYYKNNGIEKIVCEKKHMGSRAIAIICKDNDVAKSKFDLDKQGIVYSRLGRRFFNNDETEGRIISSIKENLDKSNFWDDFDTGWVCLDCEIMPWSDKAAGLISTMYAPVGKAASESIPIAIDAMNRCINRKDLNEEEKDKLRPLIDKFNKRLDSVQKYIDSYRNYCWTVSEEHYYQVAPFHILATEGAVHFDKTHIWHMDTIKKCICGGVVVETPHIVVDTNDDESVKNAIKWWSDLTENYEGMVVKPMDFISRNPETGKLLQPAVKCRGREYLRIIYGPDYLENFDKLKKRSLTMKSELALKEFSLGYEALCRFISNQTLRNFHECVFAISALESEPTDPRL